MDTSLFDRKFHGRRQIRPLKKGSIWAKTFPSIEMTLSLFEKLLKKENVRLWMEIGFGGGEHLIQKATCNPDVTFIGCEPFVNGVDSLLKQIDQEGVNNLFIFHDDAHFLLEKIPQGKIEKLFLLFPDPWPKRKHHKRRFIQTETLETVHRVLAEGGEWRIATDHKDYQQWIRAHFGAHSNLFCWEELENRPNSEEWPLTRYEKKAQSQGRISSFFVAKKRGVGRISPFPLPKHDVPSQYE